MLSARYDSEQEELTAKIKELEKSAMADKEQLSFIEQFAEQISGYCLYPRYIGVPQFRGHIDITMIP